MLRAIEAVGVLFLLSAFFAYVLAPLVVEVRRRVRTGARKRPLSRAAALAILYALLFIPATVAWRLSGDRMTHWVRVTAPAAVDHLFSGTDLGALERLIARAPLPAGARPVVGQRVEGAIRYIERETRSTLADLISAARYAAWLVVAPVVAFFLLTGAPGFQRSTLRALPHGHLQWRGEEYLRDVNSVLAGYVRAQGAAAVIVGVACVTGFALIGLPTPLSMGVASGVLELVPAIGPLTALLMAGGQAGERLWAVVAFLGALRLSGLRHLPTLDPPRHAHVDTSRHPLDLVRRGAGRGGRSHPRHPRRGIPLGQPPALARIPRYRAAGPRVGTPEYRVVSGDIHCASMRR